MHSWQFTRSIIAPDGQQIAAIDGRVTWQAMRASGLEDQALLLAQYDYVEQGVVNIGQYSGPAQQTYRYAFTSEDRADIYFADGRFFYTLKLTDGNCVVSHQCGDDRYRGEITLISTTAFQCVWQVTGPRKNYRSHTLFSRICAKEKKQINGQTDVTTSA